MKKVKIALTCLTFALAITGAVVAKANEKKRALQATAYFVKADGITWANIVGSQNMFDAQGTSTQAALIDQNNASVLLYTSQSTSNAAKFVKP